MPRLSPASLLIAAALSGCVETHLTGSLLYMTPYNLEAMDCAELKKKADTAAARTREVEQLRDKASASAAGPVINTFVYGPDYSKARWDQQLYQGEFARKSCDVLPPAQ
jgi:hypothetical protein